MEPNVESAAICLYGYDHIACVSFHSSCHRSLDWRLCIESEACWISVLSRLKAHHVHTPFNLVKKSGCMWWPCDQDSKELKWLSLALLLLYLLQRVQKADNPWRHLLAELWSYVGIWQAPDGILAVVMIVSYAWVFRCVLWYFYPALQVMQLDLSTALKPSRGKKFDSLLSLLWLKVAGTLTIVMHQRELYGTTTSFG